MSHTIIAEHASPGGSNGDGTVLKVGRRKLTRPRGLAPLVLTMLFGGDGYFELSFVMAEVGNLHAKLGVTLYIFYNGSGG